MPKVIRYDEWKNTDDASFRAWIQVVIDTLTAAGLARTTDSGQINVEAVTRPTAANTIVGYAVWRMSDPLQSVAPVFIKTSFGSGGTSGYPRLTIDVGSGSDGAGNITGAVAQAVTTAPMATSSGSALPAPGLSMAVCNDWGVAFCGAHIGGTLSGVGTGFGFAIHRTVDSGGSPTSEGVMVNASGGSSTSATTNGTVQFIYRTPVESVQSYTGPDIAHTPFGLAGYTVGVSPQIFPTWCALPKIKPMAFLAVAPAGGSPNAGQTFQMAVVGSTARTYMSFGATLGRHFHTTTSGVPGHSFILWED